MRPVVHYMMGGVHTDINGATPLAGPVRGRRGRVRQHQRREPARVELAARAARLRRARRARRRRVRLGRPDGSSAGRLRAGARTSSSGSSSCSARNGSGASASPTIRERDAEDDGGRAPASTGPGRRCGRPVDRLPDAAGARLPTSRSTITAGRSTPSASRRSSCLHARRRRDDRRLGARAARSRAARTSAPTSRRATTSGSSRIRCVSRNADGSCRVEYLPGHDHALAARRAGLRKVARTWRIGSRCRSRATVPEQEMRRRPFEEYEVPCPKDWVVLDALNYVKDQLDGTLSYRWSCRMGICGSCGMTVNGEPKLTCATFLTDYAPGPIRVEPLRNFPVVRDLVVDIGDFMRKLTPRQAVDHPRARRSRCPRASTSRRRRSWTSTSSSACASTACCATRPARSIGLDPQFIGPAAIALAQRYNLDSRDEGGRGAARGAVGARGHLGLHVRRRMHEGVSRSTSIRPAPFSATSSTASLDWLKSFVMPRGAS